MPKTAVFLAGTCIANGIGMHMKLLPIALVTLAGCAAAAPPKSKASQGPAPERSDHVYLLSFAVEGAEPNTNVRLSLREGDTAEFTMGKNVLLPGDKATRADVGMKFRAHYRLVGDDLLFDVDTEISAYGDDNPNVRKLSTRGNAYASPDKPTIVSEIATDQKRYKLSVTPTRLH